MTKTILYSTENNIRKNCDSFVNAGDYLTLVHEINSDCVILADDPNASFLKGLVEEYGIKVAKASDVRDGLSRDEEALVSAHRYNGLSTTEIAKATGLSLIDILESDAVNGAEYRFQKVMR